MSQDFDSRQVSSCSEERERVRLSSSITLQLHFEYKLSSFSGKTTHCRWPLRIRQKLPLLTELSKRLTWDLITLKISVVKIPDSEP